jgi:flagellar protein FliO/FliZ
MDITALLRTLGGLGVVLGMLGAALWIVRRYDIALPGRIGARTGRRMELVERVALDAKRAVVLLRRDDHEHLFLLAGDQATVIESRIVRTEEAPVIPWYDQPRPAPEIIEPEYAPVEQLREMPLYVDLRQVCYNG